MQCTEFYKCGVLTGNWFNTHNAHVPYENDDDENVDIEYGAED